MRIINVTRKLDEDLNKVLKNVSGLSCLVPSYRYNLVPVSRIENFSCATVGEQTREVIGDRREEKSEEKSKEKRSQKRREDLSQR